MAITLCASSVTAAEPTLDQLLGTPSAADIVAKWKAVCFDHLGDARAQRSAAKSLAIDWPYQAMFDGNKQVETCIMVSATEPETKADALHAAVVESTAPLALIERVNKADHRMVKFDRDGRDYMIDMSLKQGTGIRIAVVALTELKKAN